LPLSTVQNIAKGENFVEILEISRILNFNISDLEYSYKWKFWVHKLWISSSSFSWIFWWL